MQHNVAVLNVDGNRLAALDRVGVAARLRELIVPQGGEDLGAIAARLGIEARELRSSIDDQSPHPTVEVLAAVIRDYGVDPSWLLTGTYDSASHRLAMEGDNVLASLKAYLASEPVRISELPPEHFRASDQKS